MVDLFFPEISETCWSRVAEVLGSKFVGEGPVSAEFERAFQEKFFPDRYCVAVNSGTSALHLAYILAGVTAGKEVVTPVFTCTATNLPILYCGGQVIFADVLPGDMNIDPTSVYHSLSKKTQAIVAVHYGGALADTKRLREIAPQVALIEDCAQNIGHPGIGIGDYQCFSFQAIKTLTSVTPETPVLVRIDGKVQIREIGHLDRSVIGQECLAFDHDGKINWSPITDFIKHWIDDEILHLKVAKGKTVSVTRSHSMIVYDGKNFVPKVAGDLRVGDYIAAPRKLELPEQERSIDLVDLLAGETLMVRDGMVRLARSGKGVNAGKWISRYLKVDEKLCEVLGYYASEGCIGNWSRNGKTNQDTLQPMFSFGAHERDTHVARLCRLICEVFPGFSANTYLMNPNQSGMRVTFGSTLVAKIIMALEPGCCAHDKKIPPCVWDATHSAKMGFLRGLFGGDGHWSMQDGYTEHNSLGVSSKQLANGLHYLLLGMGIQSRMDEDQHETENGTICHRYTCTIIGREQKQAYENCIPKEFVSGGHVAKKSVTLATIESGRLSCNENLMQDVCLLKVKDIKAEPYSGYVYDFSVEGKENFLGGYGALCLHNTGDGGMLVVRTAVEQKIAKRLRWFGIEREAKLRGNWDQKVTELGFKYQLTDVNAAIGLGNLQTFDDRLEYRRALLRRYSDELRSCRHTRVLGQGQIDDGTHAAWLATIVTSEMTRITRALTKAGIEHGPVHYENSRYEIFKYAKMGPIPGMKSLDSNYLCLPLHGRVTPEEVSLICDTIKTA